MNILDASFSILDHLDKLTPAKEKGAYICPICEDDNFKVNLKTGLYACYSAGCERELIREAIAPLSKEAKTQYRQKKARPKSGKEKERDATIAAVQVEMEAQAIALAVEGGYETPASASVRISAWAKEHGHNVYSAQQLLKQFLKSIERDSDSEDRPTLLKDHQSIKQKFGERLRYNNLLRQVELDGNFLDPGEARLEFIVNQGWKGKSGREDVGDITLMLAKENTYSPVVEYLDSVHAKYGWSNVLTDIANRYFGARETIHELVTVRFLISAVARAYAPGCKCDTALILQGEQGYFKSTFFSTLASEDWFDDSLGSASDKDERLKLHRAWMIEWAELESVFKRKDIAAVKAFMTTRIDLLRPPYGRSIESFKRGSVIVGTTNQHEFLNDATGSRRFWVVPVSKPIDRELLDKERDLIWAAAVDLYRRGEPWWLTDEEESLISEERQQFEMQDPWHDMIADYVECLYEVSGAEILETVVKLPIDRYDRPTSTRIANVLKRLGWRQGKHPVSRRGRRERVWTK